MSPIGYKAELCLVLCGRQGGGKTTWLKGLLPEHTDYTKDGHILDLTNKDSLIVAIAGALVEIGRSFKILTD